MDSSYTKDDHRQYIDDDDVPLPGFRFHPTDEELVEFYLRRKVEKKPISLELIKSVDIYKHDPWDLPKATSTAGDKEWYFFCKRGRKYKNSIRPNRVTGSGFWKATGIDKPIHSHGGQGHACIGLKKTLVYYRGSAGKGTKTDWMMHEFRLPKPTCSNVYNNRSSNMENINSTDPQQEAEIWTLCRIFKRNVSYKKYTPDWRELSAAKRHQMDTLSSKKCTTDQDHHLDQSNTYISFGASNNMCYEEKKPILNHTNSNFNGGNNGQLHAVGQLSSNMPTKYPYMETFSNLSYQDLENDLLQENWDELRSGVQLAFDPTFLV